MSQDKTKHNGRAPQGAMMTPKDAARYLSLEVSTLKARRRSGTGPKFYRYSSRCVRYRRQDLDAWIELQAADQEASEDE